MAQGRPSLGRGQVTVPVVVGLGGSVRYNLGELLLLSRGTPAVLALHDLALVVLLMTPRRTIGDALLLDSRALGPDGGTADGAAAGGQPCGTLSGCDE